MILVDTSVWIEHFRSSSRPLRRLLEEEQVLTHPFVLGEIACGNLANRSTIIRLMQALPRAAVADHDETLYFIEQQSLMGRGIGLVDVHLLASCLMQPCLLWTADKRLRAVADELRIAASFGDPVGG